MDLAARARLGRRLAGSDSRPLGAQPAARTRAPRTRSLLRARSVFSRPPRVCAGRVVHDALAAGPRARGPPHAVSGALPVNREEYARMYEAEERQWWYAGMRALSFALLERHWPPGSAGGAPPRILDAGCGTGNNLRHFASWGRPVGVDLSDEALRFCRERGVAAAGGSLMALPFGDGVFDCITSFDVIYHRWVSDDAAAVREMARVLRPGGLMLVRVPALQALWGAHDEAVHS